MAFRFLSQITSYRNLITQMHYNSLKLAINEKLNGKWIILFVWISLIVLSHKSIYDLIKPKR